MMNCRSFVVVSTLLLFVGAVELMGVGIQENRDSSKQPDSLSIGSLRGPTAIGMIRLFEEKPTLWKGDNGTTGGSETVLYSIAGSPDILVSRILSGEVDIASLPTNVAAKLYAKGVDYQLGAVTGYGVLYLLGRDTDIDSFERLQGRTIYNIGQAATPEYILRYLLRESGIDPEDDVTVSYRFAHPELAQSFIAGKVQLGVLPEPFVTQVLKANDEVSILFDLQEEWKRIMNGNESYPMSCVVVKREIVEKYPDVVRTFLQEYEKSIEWVGSNPEAAGELAEKHGIGMNADVARDAIPRLNLRFSFAADARSEVERFLSVLLEFDPTSVGGKLPGDGFYISQ